MIIGTQASFDQKDEGTKFFKNKIKVGDKIKFIINRRYRNCTVSLNGENLGVIFESHLFETEDYLPTVRLGFEGQCISVGDSGENYEQKIERLLTPVKPRDFEIPATKSREDSTRDRFEFETQKTLNVDQAEFEWLQ